MKKLLFPLITLSLIFSFALKCKKEFSFATVYSPLTFHEEWQCPPSSSLECVDTLLSQRFHYLGSGAQMLAFLGEDQTTVLKLFKMNHLLPKKWLALAPVTPAYRHRKTTMREKRLHCTFQSIKLAYEQLPYETGVIFAHLNPGFEKMVVIIDKHKEEHLINLDRTPFVLQKKAELIYTRFLRHLKNGDIQTLYQEREKILFLVARRCCKGIVDSDSGVSANYGFVDDKAVQIDIGELSCKEAIPEEISQEVQRIHNKIDQQLKKQERSLHGTS